VKKWYTDDQFPEDGSPDLDESSRITVDDLKASAGVD
jgi:hypothetical protein